MTNAASAQEDDFDATVEVVEPSWFERVNPWSEEKRLERRWREGIETPDALNLESLVLDEAHSFLLFDPVPERLARGVARQWFTLSPILGTYDVDLNLPTMKGTASSNLMGFDVRRAIEDAPGPNSFSTRSTTYEFRLLTDVSKDPEWAMGYSMLYYAQGKKLTFPVPWGRTSFGLDVGTYLEAGAFDESNLFPTLLATSGGTLYADIGGYAGCDVYQQVIRDWLSAFATARLNFGGLVVDNDTEIFDESRYRYTTTFGGGVELRVWKDPDVTAQFAYTLGQSEDEMRTLVNDSQLYTMSLNF